MKKIISLMLALCLCLGLTACGGGNDNGDSQPENTQTETNSPAPEETPAETPEETPEVPEETPTETPEASGEPTQEPEEPALSLSRSDFTLFAAGASYTLKAEGAPDGTTVTFTSDNEEVATVDENGKVTAVAPGTAMITAKAGDLTAECIVRCNWSAAESPSPSPNPDPSPSQDPDTPEAPAGVDLSDFYTTLTSNYEFPSFLSQASAELLDGYFAGLSGIKTEQCLVYINMMSMNMGEIALIQVSDSADVDTVKSILQGRIDQMVNGGAWYPEPTRLWSEDSRVVSNGNYIMMVVHEECDAIVADFNALF